MEEAPLNMAAAPRSRRREAAIHRQLTKKTCVIGRAKMTHVGKINFAPGAAAFTVEVFIRRLCLRFQIVARAMQDVEFLGNSPSFIEFVRRRLDRCDSIGTEDGLSLRR
jgi:hypothetical protein